MNKRKINIFGTSGSIGQSTLQVLRERKELYDFVTFYDEIKESKGGKYEKNKRKIISA